MGLFKGRVGNMRSDRRRRRRQEWNGMEWNGMCLRPGHMSCAHQSERLRKSVGTVVVSPRCVYV
jgi:hypothetical protein